MNVKCEFKLNKKIDVTGIDFTYDKLESVKSELIELIRNKEVIINSVEQYQPKDENPDKESENVAQINGTFFDINIDLLESQFELWKVNKETIFEKTIKQLESEHLYISSLWDRDDEQHIGFIKEFL